MTEYLTEQEQIEILKNWLKQYSLVILAGIGLSILFVSGWHYWQDRQMTIRNEASAAYDELLSKRAQNDAQGTIADADKLMSQYPKTAYGEVASLMLAREAIVNQRYQDAINKFQWVINKSHIAPLRQIARLRLARVQIALQKPEDAIKTLKRIDDKTFLGLIDEVRGDAYLAMKKPNDARDAYRNALKELPNAPITRPILQMKYDNLTTLGS